MNANEKYLQCTERLFKNAEVMLGRKPEFFEVPLLMFAYSQGRIDEINSKEEGPINNS